MLGAGNKSYTLGGPTARVMSALGLEASELFTPLIPGMIAGAIWVVFVAYYLEKERKRLGIMDVQYLKQMQTMDEQVQLSKDSA